jgi:hypothetical protein
MLPLTARLERTFGAVAVELPAATRTLLLVAALDEGDRLDEILTAGGIVSLGTIVSAHRPPVRRHHRARTGASPAR